MFFVFANVTRCIVIKYGVVWKSIHVNSWFQCIFFIFGISFWTIRNYPYNWCLHNNFPICQSVWLILMEWKFHLSLQSFWQRYIRAITIIAGLLQIGLWYKLIPVWDRSWWHLKCRYVRFKFHEVPTWC